jgi:hypothetical protein
VLTIQDVRQLGFAVESYDDSVVEDPERGLRCEVRDLDHVNVWSSIALTVEVAPASQYDTWLKQANQTGGPVWPRPWNGPELGERSEWRSYNQIHTLYVFFLSGDGRCAVKVTGNIDGPADETVVTVAARTVLAHLETR